MSRVGDVVSTIRDMIVSGELRPGDRLPIEADLCTKLGVSRGSVREGVRALSVLGILDVRQGAGTYVTSLDPGSLLASVGTVSELRQPGDEVNYHQVRRVLEAQAAAEAARSTTAERQSELDACVDSLEALARSEPIDHDAFLAQDRRFHRLIAEHSGNPVLAALVEALATRTVDSRLRRNRGSEQALQTVAEHRPIADAIASGDAERARLEMNVHLLGVEDFLRRQLPERE